VLLTGKIERWVKEMLFAAISKDRNCHYCAAAHIACCRMLGLDPEMLNALVRDVNSLSNPKLRDIILFGLKCSKNPQGISEADYEKLRHHGLNQPEILELIAMSGLAVYANIMADATGMEADAIFVSRYQHGVSSRQLYPCGPAHKETAAPVECLANRLSFSLPIRS
jgi:uncharacterized peroxidase-related enzyme